MSDLLLVAVVMFVVGTVGYFGGRRDERRESLPAPYQATMTLLPDGSVIFGTPADTSAEQAFNLRDGITRWRERGDVLVLPWPTEVMDRRRAPYNLFAASDALKAGRR